ncbi:MAG: tripartite tricarboxylate transporter substrate binding protein [Burkholderiales bacterium]|nr:tripartite tricarboxylate transporter substrate binding protein [Burkholderiales bacterium]
MIRFRPFRHAALVGALLACLVSAAVAQEFPSRPLRLVVPWPAGGGPDIAARIVAEHLGQRLGRPVVVDNRAGATGRIGTEAVAKGEADGYTLALANVSTHVLPVAGGLKLAYDPVRDFAPVGLIGGTPGLLVVHPGVAAKNLAELIALAKASPGKLSFASPGTGSGFHITAEMFRGAAGIDLLHVPFKGAAPALTEVLGGRVDMVFDQQGALAQVAAGKLRAIATTGPKRWSAAPDVPTLDEAGLKGFEALSWFGIFVPAATPAPVVARLSRDLQGVLGSAEGRKALLDRGVEPMPGPPEDLRRRQSGDIERWGRAIREAKIVIE